MTQAPFQTSGNVSDIAPVQLKGGFTPDTGIADAVVDVANTVIPVIRQNLEDSLTEDVSGKIKAVSLALKATRFPSIQDSVFSEEALANPNVALALKEFTKIQDAAGNGRLPGTFVLERLEIIQNDAIRNAPEFEAEIRGAMRDATGQDPAKTLFSQMLNPATKRQSAQDKAFEQLDIQAIKLGTTRDKIIGMNQVAAQNKLEQDKYDLSSKEGKYTVNTLGSEVVNRGATIMTDIMADVLAMNTAGTPISPEIQNALIAKVNASFGATSSALLAKTSKLNVPGSVITAEIAPLTELRDNTINMIKDGTLVKLLNQNSDVIVADAQNTFLNNPVYGKMHAVLGSEGTLKFMEFKKSFGGSQKAEALLQILNSDANALFEVDAIMKHAVSIGDGAELETKAAKQARIIAAASGAANSAAGDEYQLKAIEDIKKYGGDELGWSNFANNNMLTATGKSSAVKAVFLNMQASTTAGLSEELVQLAGTPDIQLERLALSEAGLVVTSRPVGDTAFLSTTAQAADASLQTYVRRFNRANTISAKYNGAGILPASRYQGTEMYWNTIKQAAGDVVKPKETDVKKTRTVIRNPDGSLGFGE